MVVWHQASGQSTIMKTNLYRFYRFWMRFGIISVFETILISITIPVAFRIMYLVVAQNQYTRIHLEILNIFYNNGNEADDEL